MAEFRSIGDLATQVGHFCWLEHRIFELTGEWAGESAPGLSGVNLFWHELSVAHGDLSGQWRSHLPVRAGVDAHALVAPPTSAAERVLATLAEAPDQVSRLNGMVSVVLPRLLATYAEDLTHSSPVSEGPVRSLLALAAFRGHQELGQGADLLQSLLQLAESPQKVLEFGQALERSLNNTVGIFPSEWAS
jgi:hypothetical protein